MNSIKIYYKGINFTLFLFLIFVFFSCQDDGVSDPGTGPAPGPNAYDWTFQYSDWLLNYTDVFFVDNRTGWVVGEYNTILSTNDAGVNWPQAPVNSFEGNFRSVYLINETQGWISGDLNGTSIDGNVYISVNGGAYPESQISTIYPLNSVFSLDKDHVWAGGESGQMVYTTDGGSNWIESSTILEFEIFDIHFLNQDKGFASGSYGNIVHSSDGGMTWQSDFKYSDIDILAIHFTDSINAWACGSKNSVLLGKYNGSGLQWTVTKIFSEPAGFIWRDIFFIDDRTGWVVGNAGAVYKSDDGGTSWVKESTETISNLNAIHMVDGQKGWIAGNEGAILTYTPSEIE